MGGSVGCVLPVKARDLLVILGVRFSQLITAMGGKEQNEFCVLNIISLQHNDIDFLL